SLARREDHTRASRADRPPRALRRGARLRPRVRGSDGADAGEAERAPVGATPAGAGMRIEEHIFIPAAPDDVWELIADPVSLGELDDGVIVEPDRPGERPGVRSRYRAILRVG